MTPWCLWSQTVGKEGERERKGGETQTWRNSCHCNETVISITLQELWCNIVQWCDKAQIEVNCTLLSLCIGVAQHPNRSLLCFIKVYVRSDAQTKKHRANSDFTIHVHAHVYVHVQIHFFTSSPKTIKSILLHRLTIYRMPSLHELSQLFPQSTCM